LKTINKRIKKKEGADHEYTWPRQRRRGYS
jgi:hypothetical protein